MLDNTELFWEESWIKHIDGYLEAIPRTGIFIEQYFKKSRRLLEIAGGSCRDSRHLANAGFDATGSDFDKKTLDYLQKVKFKKDILNYSNEDAFNLTFSDDEFNLVFHNGFFVLFNDDENINKMLKEQERVSSKYVVFFVHNVTNKKLVNRFKEKSKTDKLYDVRFFEKDEIVDIVKISGVKYKKIDILKFGGLVDVLYKKKLKRRVPNILYPVRKYLIPRIYQLQKWRNTERICCVIELDK